MGRRIAIVGGYALAISGFFWLCGCGSGGSTSNAPADQGDPLVNPLPGDLPGGDTGPAVREGLGTAVFEVDLDSGDVAVTPLEPAASNRALFTGRAIQFNSSKVLDEPGNTGVRVLRVSMTNRWGLPIGRLPDGTVTGLRVLFSAFSNSSGSSLAPATQVSTLQRLGVVYPMGIAVGADSAIYVSDRTTSRIMRARNGELTLFAGGAGGSGDGVGSGAGIQAPYGMTIDPTDGALIVAEASGKRIRRVDATGRVTTIAGGGTAATGAGHLVKFDTPVDVAATPSGVLYVSDYSANRICRIERTGADPTQPSNWTVSLLPQTVLTPWGLDVAPDGALFVASTSTHRILRVLPSGTATVIAGNGAAASVDGNGDAASFNKPTGVACVEGYVFVSEDGGHRVRRLSLAPGGHPDYAPGWRVATAAGLAAGDVDGNGSQARFNRPLALDAAGPGRLVVADLNNKSVREVLVAFADGDGGSTTTEPVQLSNATGLLPGPNGTTRPFFEYQWFELATPGRSVLEPGATSPTRDWWFVVPQGVRQFSFTVTVEAATDGLVPLDAATAAGSSNVMVTTVAGAMNGAEGFTDGSGAESRFRGGRGSLEADASGNVYVCDVSNNAVRRIGVDGRITTIAGTTAAQGATDGTGDRATFYQPFGLAVSRDGRTLYLADNANGTVRCLRMETGDPALARSWTVTTICRGLTYPTDVELSAGGDLYIVEQGWGNRVRRAHWTGGDPTAEASWRLSVFAGDPASTTGVQDGVGTAARFDAPNAACVDSAGNLYVADGNNKRVRKISPEGAVLTFAGPTGAQGASGYVDAVGANARFGALTGIAVDASGYVYVTDPENRRIRRISPTGAVSTVAGSVGAGGVDGLGSTATFTGPGAITVGPNGVLYVRDGAVIRQIHRVIGAGGQ